MNASREALSLRIADCLKRHLPPGGRLGVGYSGGLDSSVLLHLLADLRQSAGFTLAAVHVNHGLSAQADDWALHCARVCHALAVPLETHRVEVRLTGDGLEAAARAARYRVYARLDTDFLALAHHRDDQAETVLLQLLRGASLRGLAAMPEARLLRPGLVLLRPLLAATRAEISACATELGIAWIDDASNADLRLTRNALRHAVFPGLLARFPDAPRVLARSAAQFAEATALLDALAEQDGRAAISGSGLAIPVLRDLPEPRARNLLRRFLEQSGAEIHQESLREALRQLLAARRDAQVRVVFGVAAGIAADIAGGAPVGELVLRRHRDRAVLARARPEAERELEREMARPRDWRGETCLDMGEAGCLLFQAAVGEGVALTPGQVAVRRRLGGEQMRPGPGRPRRTLKNLLREAGIPAWQRDTLPLIYVGERLAWAAGIGADSDHLAKPGQPGWLISWRAEPITATVTASNTAK